MCVNRLGFGVIVKVVLRCWIVEVIFFWFVKYEFSNVIVIVECGFCLSRFV